jgi:hypothetical protein
MLTLVVLAAAGRLTHARRSEPVRRVTPTQIDRPVFERITVRPPAPDDARKPL